MFKMPLCFAANDVKQCVREALNKIGKGSETAYGRPAPVCDTYGDYSPRRCKKGLMCVLPTLIITFYPLLD